MFCCNCWLYLFCSATYTKNSSSDSNSQLSLHSTSPCPGKLNSPLTPWPSSLPSGTPHTIHSPLPPTPWIPVPNTFLSPCSQYTFPLHPNLLYQFLFLCFSFSGNLFFPSYNSSLPPLLPTTLISLFWIFSLHQLSFPLVVSK